VKVIVRRQNEAVVTSSYFPTMIADMQTRLDFVKIDVEGSEADVLLGMSKILERHRPVIYLDVTSRRIRRQRCSSKGLFSFRTSLR